MDNNIMKSDRTDDVVMAVCLLNEKDKKWLIQNLSEHQQQKLLAKLSAVNVSSGAKPISQLSEALRYDVEQNDELGGILKRSFETNRSEVLVFLSNESSWVRAYLLAKYPAIFRDVVKDRAISNKWNNIAGFEAISRGSITSMATQAINEVLLHKIGLFDKKMNPKSEKRFIEYIEQST